MPTMGAFRGWPCIDIRTPDVVKQSTTVHPSLVTAIPPEFDAGSSAIPTAEVPVGLEKCGGNVGTPGNG